MEPRSRESSLAGLVLPVGHTFPGGGYAIPAGLGEELCGQSL